MGTPSAAIDHVIAELAAAATHGSIAEFRTEALARLQQLVGFECGITWSLREDSMVVRGVDQGVHDVFAARRAEVGGTIGRLLAAASSAGGAIADREVFGPREMAALPLYSEMGPLLGTRDHITVALNVGDCPLGGMYLGRSGRCAGRFAESDVAVVRRVVSVLSLAEAAHHRPPPAPLDAPADDELRLLTRRERDLLDVFALGLRYTDAAAALGISVNTVREYVRSIYSKLGVASKTEAVLRFRGGRAQG